MFQTINRLEAVLWIGIGIAFCVGLGRDGRARLRCIVAAITFVVFGLSDVVEMRTGAWWQPWWLLCWKGACLLVLLVLLIDHFRGRTDRDRR